MTVYAMFLGNAALYLGGAIVVLLLTLFVVWALYFTVAVIMKSSLTIYDAWDAFTSFKDWYNSDAGTEARDAHRIKLGKFKRITNWLDQQ